MKRLLLAASLVGLMSTSSKAQIGVGDIAPDFTLTDINNVTHNLYDYLNQGYMVLIDVSATWCGPCWNFSNSGVMKHLYEEYGPNGTVEPGKIMPIFIEGDQNTTIQDLNGLTATTQGDWVTGKPYPIIDDASQNANYLDGGFPTFTLICPNKEIIFRQAGANTAMTTVAFWTAFLNECVTPVEGKNVAADKIVMPSTACPGNPTELKVKILNFGTEPLTDVQINAKVNGNIVASTTWSGLLETFETEEVVVGNYTFYDDETAVEFEANTNNDAEPNDNMLATKIYVTVNTFRSLVIETKTDDKPQDISWNFKDNNGNIVLQHNYNAEEANKVIYTPILLNGNECLSFEVLDAGGDGITNGYLKIVAFGDNVVYEQNGSFGAKSLINLKTGAQYSSLNSLVDANSINLYPNPVNNTLNIDINALQANNVTFNVVNILGQSVMNSFDTKLNAGKNSVVINTTSLSSGVYFVNIVTEDGSSLQQKFMKQ